MERLPEPKPGLVIRYAYLWQDEARTGRDEGSKDRPCVVVLAVEMRDGKRSVTVAPITHSPPRGPTDAVEIPAATKQRLGLDAERSWVVATEVNQFSWPGPDLRPATPVRWDFGFLPGSMVNALRERMAACRRLSTVRRDDD